MKPLLKYALLACVLSPFVFGDLAMAQRAGQRTNGKYEWVDDEQVWTSEGRRGTEGVTVEWRWRDGKWVVWSRSPWAEAPSGRIQRMPNTNPTPPPAGPPPAMVTQPPSQPQPTWTPSESGTRGYSGNKSRKFSLEPGDVILTVNGEDIFGRKSLIYAVNSSPQTMEFTVRDRRNGQIRHFTTTLASSGYRLGIYCADHPDGARVTSVMPNSAARRCILVE